MPLGSVADSQRICKSTRIRKIRNPSNLCGLSFYFLEDSLKDFFIVAFHAI
jgi:hypothetical protein